MTFKQSIQTCFSKYITFSGRASRSEYWWFFLFGVLGSGVAGLLDGALFGTATLETEVTDNSAGFTAANDGPIGVLFSLAILLPSLSAGWRRMHDTGRSGFYLFYPLLVMIGIGTFLAIFGGIGATETGAVAGPIAIITVLATAVLAISPLLVLWWLTRPSQSGSNEYGPNPHEVSP